MSPFVSMANTNTGAIEVLTYTSSVEHYIWFLHVLWHMQKTKKWAQKKLQRLLPNSAKNNISEQAQRVSGRCSGIMVSKQDSGANRVWALVRDNVGEPNKLWQSDPWWTSILSSDGLASCQGEVEILQAASCYRNLGWAPAATVWASHGSKASHTQWVSKIISLLHQQTDCGKVENEVINLLTSEGMGDTAEFHMNFTTGVFYSKAVTHVYIIR